MTATTAVDRTRVGAAAISIPRSLGPSKPNEDSLNYGLGDGTSEDWADFAGIVADGVGSSKAPSEASRTATETWMRFAESRFTERPEELTTFDDAQFSHLMRECLAQAHRQVQRNAPGGAATAAGVCIQGPWLLAATVGDARIYRLSHGQVQQVTPDQVDANGNPTSVLGAGSAAPVAEGHAIADLQTGDWIVLCSDGLAKVFTLEELRSFLDSSASPQAAAETLKSQALTRGTPDDLTAIIVRVEEVGKPFWSGGNPGSPSTPTGTLSPASRQQKSASSKADETSGSRPATTKLQQIQRRNGQTSTKGETDMRTTSEATSGASGDMDRRLERLERSASGGGLSQQEEARIQREFGRLEQQIQAVESRVGERTSSPTGWITAALLGGLLLGWFGRPMLGGWVGDTGSARGGAVGSSKGGTASFKLQMPKDLSRITGDQLTQSALVVRYISEDGGRKVAIFPYDGDGKPSLIYRLPKTDDAPDKGKG